MENIQKYGIYEMELKAEPGEHPFAEEVSAVFTNGDAVKKVSGFYDGDGRWIIRFMPEEEGVWRCVTSSGLSDLDGKTGEFRCLAETAGHGKVRVRNQFYFEHILRSQRGLGNTLKHAESGLLQNR